MRFLAGGPDIPDQLLEARDEGKVVFLCGAGVSLSAGMPDFPKLASYVVKKLKVPLEGQVRKLLSYWCNGQHPEIARPPLDDIFNLLQRKFDPSDVDYFIAERLKTRSGTSVTEHKTILRLSKEVDGKPRVVTTNFDRLFEVAEPDIPTFAPPSLPDLTTGQKLDGLVYLHGRIDPTISQGEERQKLVVSSADFGRAYLVEGWARDFLRELLNKYVVVLLGYSASDPPVKYLLQGLHSMGLESRNTIYAFAGGSEEAVQAQWEDRGVTALAYPTDFGEHSALWQTLEAWAERADDPLSWQKKIVELARRGPRNLEDYERGQVASLVRNFEGAKLFADADPPLPGEWLCVFDSKIRFGRVEQDFLGSLPDFDPLIEYGLDDDPPRPGGIRVGAEPPGDDLLSIRTTDPRSDDKLRLAGMPRLEDIPLPPRLFQLALWIIRVAHEPVVLWWAAKYSSLYPFLLIRIEHRLNHSGEDFPRLARSIWNLLIERFRTAPEDASEGSLYEVSQRIENEGWTNGVLRALERSTAPHLETVSRPGYSSGRPPVRDWPDLRLADIAEFEVVFSDIIVMGAEIPDEFLPAVYDISRRHLELAAGILSDINSEL